MLIAADGARRLRSLKGQEARVLALLSAAYGKAVAPAVLGNIERAVKCWREGDECLAYIHLAHERLSRAAQILTSRTCALFIADDRNEGRHEPALIYSKRSTTGTAYIDAVEKAYNPAEPRVPAGSGRTSGEWTDSEETGADDAAREGTAGEGPQGSSLLGRMPLPAASFLAELDAAQVAELSAYASRLLGLGPVGAAVAAFGLLFIPSPNNIRVEGEVPEIPGLRYSWNRDETVTSSDIRRSQWRTAHFCVTFGRRHSSGR